METDGRYMMRNNYRYSVDLLDALPGQRRAVPVRVERRRVRQRQRVSRGACVRSAAQCLRLLEIPVRPVRAAPACRSARRQIAGFRYFNVYGPREAHKGRMASVAYHFFEQYRAGRSVKVFGASAGYAAGEQQRDFVAVERRRERQARVSSTIRERSGIFNLGTGRAATFNSVAVAAINAVRKSEAQAAGSVAASWFATAKSSTRRFRRSSSASTRAIRRPISPSSAPRGCAASFTAVEEGVGTTSKV